MTPVTSRIGAQYLAAIGKKLAGLRHTHTHTAV